MNIAISSTVKLGTSNLILEHPNYITRIDCLYEAIFNFLQKKKKLFLYEKIMSNPNNDVFEEFLECSNIGSVFQVLCYGY